MKTQATHYNILVATERGERTIWTRIGTAFPTKDGEGLRLSFNVMPTDPNGLVIMPPREPQNSK